jgi:hypothetical protein
MKRTVFGIFLAAGMLVAAPADEAKAQFLWGAHVPYALDTFDGAFGIGGRLGYDLPVLPIDIVGVGEVFFPDCGANDCSLWGASAEANLRLPIPIVRPYLTGGLGYRSLSRPRSDGNGTEDLSATGVSLGLGVDFNLAAVRLFVDGRYEWYDEDVVSQPIFRAGILF